MRSACVLYLDFRTVPELKRKFSGVAHHYLIHHRGPQSLVKFFNEILLFMDLEHEPAEILCLVVPTLLFPVPFSD